jgi:multidrug efflux pump subunit AcrB
LIIALNTQFAAIQEAFVVSVAPPPVRGIGTTGGFKLEVQDTHGGEPAGLEAVATSIVGAAAQTPGLANVFTTFNTRTPKVYADIDRVRAEMLGVNTDDVFQTLEVYLGSQYVNDFNFLGRTYRVTAQADGDFRQDLHAIGQLKTRNAKGEMVPLSSVASFRNITGPYRVEHFNLYPSAAIQGGTTPGYSTGYGLAAMEKIANASLPEGYSYSWTEIAYQERLAGNTAIYIFLASVVFVFLLLAAQYESWTLPLAVILIVPMCLLAAVSGLLARTMDVNILAQIGFVVLIGLAAKNAILIVEFARQNEEHGEDRFQAATEAARVRLRPILMTSFAFVLGVLPLVIATGAGAEMRQSLGTAVFFGMLGVTFFGLIFTPVFYVVVRKFARKPRAHPHERTVPAE